MSDVGNGVIAVNVHGSCTMLGQDVTGLENVNESAWHTDPPRHDETASPVHTGLGITSADVHLGQKVPCIMRYISLVNMPHAVKHSLRSLGHFTELGVEGSPARTQGSKSVRYLGCHPILVFHLHADTPGGGV